jgi:hypothetical protein
MISHVLATLFSLTMLGEQAVSAPAAPSTESQEEAVRLEDVQVSGRRLETLISDFVGEVAAPNRGRGLARWNENVCVGAVNLQPDVAQYLVDRVSQVADDVGLSPGAPGCPPNLVIVAVSDGPQFARDLTEKHGRALRMGGTGMDRGRAALQDFRESDRPVRWWQVSMPVDSESGKRATRIMGECMGQCLDPHKRMGGDVLSYAPILNTFIASRITSQVVDNIIRTIVVVDVNQISGMDPAQLADYIAMVSLAQIDPQADTSGYASILNTFSSQNSATSLTAWDRAYLSGLYDAERSRKNLRAGTTEITSSIRRAHTQIANAAD